MVTRTVVFIVMTIFLSSVENAFASNSFDNLTLGTYKVDKNHESFEEVPFESIKISIWANTETIVSGKIQYGSRMATFEIPLKMESQDSDVFIGQGHLISGSCTWEMDVRLVSDKTRIFVSETSPGAITDNCQGTAGWKYHDAPFVLDESK